MAGRARWVWLRFLPPAVAAGLLLATAAGFLGDWWWPLELPAHFRPHLAVAGVVLLVIAAAARRRGVLTVAAIAVAVNGAPLLPYLGFADAVQAGPPPNLRVLTLNMHWRWAKPDAFRRLIDRESPDVVLLTELPEDMAPYLAVLEPDLPYRLMDRRGSGFDVALFSRWPLSAPQVDRRAGAAFPVLAADICGAPVTERCVRVVGLHAARPFGAAVAVRSDQLALAADLAAAAPQRLAVLMGDLNLTPWAPAFSRLLERGGLRDSTIRRGLVATWMSPAVGLMIDHILASPGLSVRDNRLGEGVGSDHFPVIANLVVPPAGR